MKFRTSRTLPTVACAAVYIAILVAHVPNVFGQEDIQGRKLFFGVKPLVGGDMAKIRQDAITGAGLKMWSYSIKSTRTGPNNGKTFTGVMVGSSPLSTSGTTTTTVYVVPLVVHIAGNTFSPIVADNSCLGGKIPLTVLKHSPMVLTHAFTLNGVSVGTTQYPDAFQRANFWKKVSAMAEPSTTNLITYHFHPSVLLQEAPTRFCIRPVDGAYRRTAVSNLTGSTTLLPIPLSRP